MRLSTTQRQQVFAKFGGKCAYCGCDLPARWHADHLDPVRRRARWDSERGYVQTGELDRPENDNLDNMMPACARCNISKGTLTLDQWREWIVGHVKALNAHHTPYNIAKAFGLIVETGISVVFHFEAKPSKEG